MNKYLIILVLFLTCNNIFSQTRHNYENNFVSSNIRGDTIRFGNDKNRIFVLAADLSCSACLKDCAEKLKVVSSKLLDSCEYIIISRSSPSNVSWNRSNINRFSEIFENFDYYLFDFGLKNETILDISKYKFKDFPVVVVVPKLSEYVWIVKYSELKVNSIIKILEK